MRASRRPSSAAAGARCPRRAAALLLAACGAALVPARTDAAGEGVRAVRLSGAPVEGTFASIDAASLRLSGKDPVALRELVEARFPGPAARSPRPGARLRVVLRGGEEVVGTFASGDAEGLTVEPSDLPAVEIPFDAVLRVEAFDPESTDPCVDPTLGRPPRPGTDVAHTRSGDAFAGTLLSAAADGVVLESGRDRRQPVAWADLAVLHLDEPPMAAPAELVLEVETSGGSRLVATSVVGDARGLRVETRSGLSLAVPLSSVRALRGSGGSFVYATDLRWEATHVPFYGTEPEQARLTAPWWTARADRRPTTSASFGAALSCPLRVAGTTYRRGFGVVAKSLVTIPLGKAYRSFQAHFGVDDEAKTSTGEPGGNVVARVLADGKEVWSSGGGVVGGTPARAVGPVSVEGVETLVLEVDFAGDFGLDRADWVDPILVRAAR